ncbi:MAG TPA: SWIM zinc finger family protein [Gemmataceae bacterium]|nr:SWIM zinc finger family protein [Gemmataceae bacterium]
MAEAKAARRTIRLVRPPDRRGVGVFSITEGNRSQFYVLAELPCEIGGRGFAVHRLGLGNLYHVRVERPEDCSCECLGFLRWGRCKHVLGLKALIRQDLL